MANKLRAFISSTMEDLGNERRAVVQQLLSMGIEPINAEDISPAGRPSWDTIRSEIDQCHLFVLILGDRYGWEPDDGYGAGTGLSVTHLELQAAREGKKLVLAFMKKLRYGATVDERRDLLRKEVSDWANGVFRQDFEWADELARKVGASITSLFTDALHKQLVRYADETSGVNTLVLPPPCAGASLLKPGNEKVLLAGAGMSIAAGYPTALLLMGILANDLWGQQQDASQLVAYNFSEFAAYYQAIVGRKALVGRIQEVIDTPQAVLPTPAHMKAVRIFRNIVTTNYDRLFELASELQGLTFRVVHPFDAAPGNEFDGLTIYKLVGSALSPHTLILTSEDLPRAAQGQVFAQVQNLIANNEIVVIGHSLRDGNVQILLKHRDPKLMAVYVSPSTAAIEDMMLSRYGLKRVRATADDFMSTFPA
ncbi:DUF4062 domain-containing protein [Pseudomonas syringae pv. atrofaciens]|uniref:DUF4062 domain-containing protein n=1 Tax=Pseudomonas syringae TaxID=317 RepID=UPI00351E443E